MHFDSRAGATMTSAEVVHGQLSRGWKKRSLPVRDGILEILSTFRGALSTRQVYYQLVGRRLVPNRIAGYRAAARVLVRMRRLGEIPYDRIVDRGRRKHVRSGWDSARELMEQAARQFRRDYWTEQPKVVMVACEKAALEGVFAQVVDEYGASLWVVRGFISESFAYDFAEDIRQYNKAGQHVVVYYFGDHDPSGKDIPRDLSKRLRGFGAQFDWIHGGITAEDIEKYNIPPLPAKASDSRSRRFFERYGSVAAELDALPPDILQERIRQAIERHIEWVQWITVARDERIQRADLDLVVNNWESIKALASSNGIGGAP